MWVEDNEAIWQMEDFWKSEHIDYNIPLFEENIKKVIEDANKRNIEIPKKFKGFIKWEEEEVENVK